MSQRVKLRSKLAKDEDSNGLDSVADRLLDGQRLCVLVWIIPMRDNRDIATNQHQVEIEIVRAEPLGTPAEVSASFPGVHEAYLKAFGERRAGAQPLPFDVFETVEGGYVADVEGED
jgi:hypothetical protein